jgi:hypothetical protein
MYSVMPGTVEESGGYGYDSNHSEPESWISIADYYFLSTIDYCQLPIYKTIIHCPLSIDCCALALHLHCILMVLVPRLFIRAPDRRASRLTRFPPRPVPPFLFPGPFFVARVVVGHQPLQSTD